MNIPFVDLKKQYHALKAEMDAAIIGTIEDTAFVGGSRIDEFEKKFAEKIGVKHCISVANGTDSLYILMKMMGIGAGDEVITAANSWISSSETISQTGAKPVFVDIDPTYGSIDETLLEAAITERTKAIIPVHLQGQMCNMDAIMELATRKNIPVIEDCAQSHFSEYNGKIGGTMGLAGSFSFYPGKNLGAYGDAGCIITNSDELAIKCRMYARHGALIKHQHQIEGINSRLDGIQAAVLLVKLPHILKWTQQRIQIAKWYDQYLLGIKEIDTPKVRPNTKHTFHLYMIQCERRDELAIHLKNQGIETAIHYPVALPNLPAYAYLNLNPQEFPMATKAQSMILSLPMFPELTEHEVKYIAEKIAEFYV